MWTPATRGRMAKIEKKTKRYPSDLTDEEWARIEPFLPRASTAGRPIEVDLREVLNAIRYMARSGGGWRMLPNDFPPWQTVYWWFRRFVRRFLFQTIHDVALMLDRERVGREASPTGGVVDSQSVKAPEAKTRGYDAGKRIVGRKRHIAVDTDGRLLMVNLTPADISDSAGAQMILDGVRKRWPWLKHLFADGEFWRLGSRRGSLCSADGQERPVFRRIVANQAQRKRGNRRSPGRICRSPLRSDNSMGSKGREARRARLASSRVKARRPLAAPSSWSTVPRAAPGQTVGSRQSRRRGCNSRT